MKEKAVFERLMKKQMEPGPLRDQLKAMHIQATYGNGILFQLVKRAAEGDLSAAKYILGVLQEEAEPTPEGLDLSQVSTEELRRMAEGSGKSE